MFLHTFTYTNRLLSRKKGLLFWSMVFPIILGFLFKLAFGGLVESEQFKRIDVSYEEGIKDDSYFWTFLNQLDEEGYFNLTPARGNKLLEEGKVKVHIVNKDYLLTNKSGLEQTIVESIINQYLQKESTIKNIWEIAPGAKLDEALKLDDYIEDASRDNMNFINTYFYSLIGMQAIYGYMWGLEVMYMYEANLSTLAKRNAISPTKKGKSLLASLLSAWIINILVLLVNVLVQKYAFKVDFGDRILELGGLLSIAGLNGVCLGGLIAVSNRRSVDTKIGIGISISMFLSFLAGMMFSRMKLIVERYFPIANRLNPVSLVTDGIYSLYYYGSLDRYLENIYWLSGVTILFLLATFYMIRGKKYDSL